MRSRNRPPEGKLSKYRAARDRAYEDIEQTAPEPAPVHKPWAGRVSYLHFHALWRALIAPIPKTDLGLEITLIMHTTLRAWFDENMPATTVDTDGELDAAIIADSKAHDKEVREALAVVKAIKDGDVIPFTLKRRSNSVIPPRPKWTQGPYDNGRAS
jgi:hypothetical protein